MALQDTDLLVVNRGGTNYQVSVADFKTEINPMQGKTFYGGIGINPTNGGGSGSVPNPSGTADAYVVFSSQGLAAGSNNTSYFGYSYVSSANVSDTTLSAGVSAYYAGAPNGPFTWTITRVFFSGMY